MDELRCRHFLVSHTAWYDAANPDSGYSLGRIVVNVRPTDGGCFPIRITRLFAFIQVFGSPDDYSGWLRLVRIDTDDLGEETEADPRDFPHFRFPVTGLDLVESFLLTLPGVPFPEVGV